MKKIIPLFFLLLFANKSFAQQPCNDDIIMAVKGKWVTSPDNFTGSDKTFPASQYSQIKTRLDKMAVLFREAYPQPSGMEANWYRSIRGNPIINNGPVPYQFNSLYKAWYCNPNRHKLMQGTETGTWAYVFVNDLHKFIEEIADLKINNTTAYYLPAKTGEWKGMTLFDVGSTQYKQHKAVLLTHGNQLPFIPVTRLQYIQAIKQNLEDEKKSEFVLNDKMKIRSEAEQQAEKQRLMDGYVTSFKPERREKAKENFLKNYKTDQQRKEEDLRSKEKRYADRINAIENIRKNFSKNELDEPAIINPFQAFKEFTTEEKGGRRMVFINTNYFNMQLPRYVPQIMVLYWRTESNNAPSQYFKQMFESNFPIEKLKAMIDK